MLPTGEEAEKQWILKASVITAIYRLNNPSLSFARNLAVCDRESGRGFFIAESGGNGKEDEHSEISLLGAKTFCRLYTERPPCCTCSPRIAAYVQGKKPLFCGSFKPKSSFTLERDIQLHIARQETFVDEKIFGKIWPRKKKEILKQAKLFQRVGKLTQECTKETVEEILERLQSLTHTIEESSLMQALVKQLCESRSCPSCKDLEDLNEYPAALPEEQKQALSMAIAEERKGLNTKLKNPPQAALVELIAAQKLYQRFDQNTRLYFETAYQREIENALCEAEKILSEIEALLPKIDAIASTDFNFEQGPALFYIHLFSALSKFLNPGFNFA